MRRPLGAIVLRVALVLLTFALVVILAQVALVAARTRLDRAPLGDIVGQAIEGTADYFGSLLGGSLGEASSTSLLGGQRRAMGELLADAYGKSMALVALAMAVATTLGLGAGVAAASARRGPLRAGLLGGATLATALPSFLVAAVLVIAGSELNARFHVRLWPTFGFGWDDHLILPVIVLAARPLAEIASHTYVAVDEALRSDHIRTARAKGLAEATVLVRHALPNAAAPILGAIAAALGMALSTLPVVEVVFSWPGLGFGLLQAIRRFDAATAGTLLGALAVTIAVARLGLDALAVRFAHGGGS